MRKIIFVSICSTFLIVTALWSQAAAGSLSGKVTNTKGAAIPNAAVTVTNVNTNTSVKVLSSSDGSFTVNNIAAPGTYTIEVETAGYKKAREQNVVLATAGPATVNVTLLAGEPTDVVDLTAKAPASQPESGELAGVINTAEIREPPPIERETQSVGEGKRGEMG